MIRSSAGAGCAGSGPPIEIKRTAHIVLEMARLTESGPSGQLRRTAEMVVCGPSPIDSPTTRERRFQTYPDATGIGRAFRDHDVREPFAASARLDFGLRRCVRATWPCGQSAMQV